MVLVYLANLDPELLDPQLGQRLPEALDALASMEARLALRREVPLQADSGAHHCLI